MIAIAFGCLTFRQIINSNCQAAIFIHVIPNHNGSDYRTKAGYLHKTKHTKLNR